MCMRIRANLAYGLYSACGLGWGTSVAHAQFDLSWHSIDGGGATFSIGGPYSLGGTIGQADAGPAMTAGTYRLTGGFWTATGAPCGTCIGDLNHDCSVSLSDLSVLLANFGVASGATPEMGDLDGDHAVSLADLSLLLANFGTICT